MKSKVMDMPTSDYLLRMWNQFYQLLPIVELPLRVLKVILNLRIYMWMNQNDKSLSEGIVFAD